MLRDHPKPMLNDPAERDRQQQYADWLGRHYDDGQTSARASCPELPAVECVPCPEADRRQLERSRLHDRVRAMAEGPAPRDPVVIYQQTKQFPFYLSTLSIGWSIYHDFAVWLTAAQAEELQRDFPEQLSHFRVLSLSPPPDGEQIPW